MKNNIIKISLIVATSNRSDNLKDLLTSLNNHGLLNRKNIEVIIIDNTPKDSKTENICKKYRVQYLVEKIPGRMSALNLGVSKARGKYLAFTDDDVVVCDDNWLDKMVSHFENNPNLGYVAGNVLALETKTDAQKLWEKKGGLSKGNDPKIFSKNTLNTYKYHLVPWPINKIAAGANSMIPKEVLLKVGLFNTFFDPGAPIPHGGSLEIVYRIIKNGYHVIYDPEAKVFHKHPKTVVELKRKLYIYGLGNTAYQMYIFVKYKDFRSLYWSLIGHSIYVLRNLLKSFVGKYPLPFSYTIYSLAGSFVGAYIFVYKYLTRDRRLYA